MTQKDYLDEAIESFRETRQLTYDFLNALTDEQLTQKLPRPDLDTFGKHLQELGDTQESYALGIARGAMDFGTIRSMIDYTMVQSKELLQSFLRKKDEQLFDNLKDHRSEQVIRWDGEEISLVEHLSRLSRHELFHHGQFVTLAYQIGVPFPESWVNTWVLPSRSGELYKN